ncbi:calcium-binding protein, partial [Aliarcobacter cryaerophilus]|uniref:calcium-binding protein n=1 Tax=Aliarcobacter cryaerophilus TaxID=28198 RepID=UPI0021B1D48C
AGETTAPTFESLNVDKTKATIEITDTLDPTTVTITAAKVTDKVITKDNFENNAGFTVKAKDPYGNDAKISTHTGPAGFGVESLDETNSGKLGQTDQVYSGHTSEIGVVNDGSTYKSESIEVEFKNPVHTLDVAFAWRHNGETAKVDFYNGNEKVGYAIVKGGGNDTLATIEYYDKNGNLKETVNAQGGTDNVDLVYTFKPAGDVTFTKAVFSADGAGSDYLIHSISYKEVSEGDSTTIVGSDEVAFKISTSNIPDPSKYDFIDTFPTADVKIVDKNTGEDLFNGTVNLDKNGNAIVTVRTDGTKDLIAEVSNVQGNFEEVDYKNAKTEVEASIKATASNDSFNTLEDTNYVLKTTDFGDNNQNVAKIKFDSLPANGTIYVLKSEYTGSINDRAEYTSSENKVYIEVKAGDIVDISKIENGNVVFVPNKDTDADSSFKFSVSNGNGVFSNSYETKVNVIAFADKPDVEISITKIGATTISTGNTNGGNSGTSSSFDKLIKQTATGKDGNLEQDIQQSNNNQNIEKDYQNVNANNITTGLGNDTLKFQALNNKTITTGEGNDKVIIDNGSNNNQINVGNGNNEISITHSLNQGSITAGSGNDTLFVGNAVDGSTINMGAGNDKVQIDGDFKSKVYLGAGDDKIALYSPHTNFEADGRSYIDGGNGFDTLYVENLNSSDFKVKIKSTGEEITWEKYSELNNHKDGEANIEFVIHHKTNTNQGFVVKNIEQIVFKDKTFGEKDNSIKAVAYKVDISAALTDTDGSETLSVVIKNVPTGAVLESTKYDVSKNSDGSWSVNFKAGTTGGALLKIEDSLTMKVPESYKGEINLQIEAKATEIRDNADGTNFKIATDEASIKTVTIEPFKAELDIELSSATINTITTKDVNTVATEQAGIKLGADGKYYETKVVSKTEKIVDNEALKDLTVTINGKTYTGITIGADGKYYVIDNTIAKEQKTIEVEREVTKTVSLTKKQVESFMIEVTKETKGIVLGKEVTNLGKDNTINKNSSKTYTLDQPTSNIEIKLASGSGKIEFVDKNGEVIGSSTSQRGTDSKGYSVPKDAVGVKITATNALKMDAIKYHVDPHEETVQVGGKILDIEGMEKAGISWNNTISETKNDTSLSNAKIGSTVGDGNIQGFNPEDKKSSQEFDFGKDKAYQLVTIKVDVDVKGSWNFNNSSTKDVFVVSANGVPQGAYNYTSSQDYSNDTPKQNTLNKDIAAAKTNGYDLSYVDGKVKTYEYKVYLDENGKVQMNFVVASTNTDEFVNIKNITVNYEGLSGFVQTKTEIETVTETIFVGVPTNVEYTGDIPTKEITKYETVEVETSPIYTKLTQYEYKLDLSASIIVGNGELSNITLKDIPNGVTVKGYEANEDGSYTIKIGEDGKSQLTLVSDSLLSDAEKKAINATVEANSEDGSQSSKINVNIEGDISHSIKAFGTEDNDDISINTENSTSIDVDGGAGYDTIKLEENNDIDFSNLGNLIKNIEAIDLTEGDHKLTNISLEDVLKMTDSSKELIILRDSKDSVLFKDTIGENGQAQTWLKAENSIVEDGKTFEVYTNSGDESLKVKVEQPISEVL